MSGEPGAAALAVAERVTAAWAMGRHGGSLSVCHELERLIGCALEAFAAARVAEEREEIQALRSCAEKRARWQEEAESENERLRAVVEAARLVARYTVVNEIASRAMSEQALVGALLQTRLEALDRPAGMMEVQP